MDPASSLTTMATSMLTSETPPTSTEAAPTVPEDCPVYGEHDDDLIEQVSQERAQASRSILQHSC